MFGFDKQDMVNDSGNNSSVITISSQFLAKGIEIYKIDLKKTTESSAQLMN